jgi:thiosulfate dehydrogenase
MKKQVIQALVVGAAMLTLAFFCQSCGGPDATSTNNTEEAAATGHTVVWAAPDTNTWAQTDQAEQLRYGRELVANTSAYLGPEGSIARTTNGLNCQNCHLDAGTRPFTNNYALVASTYPRFRARSGTEETVHKRIADCFQRSLNGQAPDSLSVEGKAIAAYVLWVGSGIQKGETPTGAGLEVIDFLDRAADPEAGAKVYVEKCQSCHQPNGQGLTNGKGGYAFPPLWGPNSYNHAAGLYRLSRFASYVKQGMPLGATHETPLLTDEEAWDVAAYVNSQERPGYDLRADWPDVSGKPVDHPFGPYSDTFPELQHKYGPFKPIKAARDQQKQSS